MDIVKIAEKKPNDFVTEVDQRVEQEIINIVRKAYPSHGFLGEEGGEVEGDDYQWIIDPIDGTRNFIHGFPHFAVSIAIAYKNRIEHGVIYDPNREELFTATRGKGAQLNDRRIRVGERKKLEECLLGTGFAYRHIDKTCETPEKILRSILPNCGDVRRAGAATLDLAYVACGRLDGVREMGLKPGTLLPACCSSRKQAAWYVIWMAEKFSQIGKCGRSQSGTDKTIIEVDQEYLSSE